MHSVRSYCLATASIQSQGIDTVYMESKPNGVVQSAQQQSLMSSVYLPTTTSIYNHSDDDDEQRVNSL